MTNPIGLKALSIPVSYLPRSGPLVRRLAPHHGHARQRFRCGAIFDLDLSDRIQAESFLRRGYDRPLCEWISRRLKPGDLFVDVGANVGLVSFAVAMTGARVLAFEPNPANCAQWRANRALNPQADADLIEAAVGERADTVRLVMPQAGESGWGRIGTLGSDVRQVALDDVIDHAAVIKIDVEGYEPCVLRGAERLLSRKRVGAVICEVTGFGVAEETTALLKRYGYRPSDALGLDRAFVRT